MTRGWTGNYISLKLQVVLTIKEKKEMLVELWVFNMYLKTPASESLRKMDSRGPPTRILVLRLRNLHSTSTPDDSPALQNLGTSAEVNRKPEPPSYPRAQISQRSRIYD